MVLGTTASILLGIGAIGAGVGASKLLSGGSKGPSSPQPLPQPPSSAVAAEKGEEMARRRRALSTKTIYTSPLGVAGEAQVARKTLLGL